jgi:hypothetical protein
LKAMLRRKRLIVVALAVALGVAATAAVVLASRGGDASAEHRQPQGKKTGKKTYAELVAANYKILRPAQTKRLLDYADAVYACLSKQIGLGRPQPSPTKIVMSLPAGAKPDAVARLGFRCAMKIGDPPRDSSFQVRRHAVILYLPKYCILDKKTVTKTVPLPKP